MKFQNVKKVLEDFNKNNVNYCVLRNYSDPDFKNVKDVDILVSYKDGYKVKKILKSHGLTKTFLGLHIFSSRLFDIKMGCLEHNGYYIKSGEEILKNKRKHEYFYILSSVDELMHIMLKFLHNNKYKTFIENITTNASFYTKINTIIELYNIYGLTGVECIEKIFNKDYTDFDHYRKNLLNKVNSYNNRILYYFYRIMYPALKRDI